jgi:hypothetical protein
MRRLRRALVFGLWPLGRDRVVAVGIHGCLPSGGQIAKLANVFPGVNLEFALAWCSPDTHCRGGPGEDQKWMLWTHGARIHALLVLGRPGLEVEERQRKHRIHELVRSN